MLTATNDILNPNELIVDRDNHCTHFESGNPFLSGHEVMYSTDDEYVFNTNTNSVNDKKTTVSVASSIIEKSLQASLNRFRRFPNNPEVANTVALNYLRKGDTEKAIEILSNVLKSSPHYFKAKANLAKCYTLIGKVDVALNIYKELEQTDPNDVVFANIALLNLKRNKRDVALKYWQKSRDINPVNSSTWNNIGMIHLLNNDIGKAIAALRKAYSLNGEDSNIVNNIGVSFVVQGNLSKAITYFQISNKLKGNVRSTLLNLSLAYQLGNRHQDVIDLTSEYIQNYDEEIELRNVVAWSHFKIGSFDKSLKLLNSALIKADHSDNRLIGALFNNVGITYDNMGLKDKAIEYLEMSLSYYPEGNIDTHCNLIHLCLNRDVALAIQKIDSAFEYYPNHPLLRSYLGEYYFKIENYEKAKECFYSTIESNPEISLPYASLTSILADIDDNLPGALEIIEKGVSLFSENIQLINNYAYVLILLGNLSKARLVLDKSLENNDVYMMATYGLLLIKEGHIDEGRKYYNRSKYLAGSNSNLGRLVEQKKQLELGRYFSDKNNTPQAIRHLSKGVKIKTKEKYYKNKIIDLLNHIQST